MFHKVIPKALHQLTNLVAIVSDLVGQDIIHVFLQSSDPWGGLCVLLDIDAHVEFRLEEGKNNFLFHIVVHPNVFRKRETIPSKCSLVFLLHKWGVVVDRIEGANENVVNENHLNGKCGDMVLEIPVWGVGDWNKCEAILPASNLRGRHQSKRTKGYFGVTRPFMKQDWELQSSGRSCGCK